MLFPGRPAIGETISINGVDFTVIGEGKKIGRGNNTYDDEKTFIPVTTILELFPLKGDNIPQDALTSIQYNPTIKNDNTTADIAVHRVIAENHGFDPSLKDAFNEWDTITESHLIGAIFTAMDVFLGNVGLVTLGLGAIGIINIMLVSVTERTRDIGVMKAVGATRSAILAQFFWEGLLLTGLSGVIGILVSRRSWSCSKPRSLTRSPALTRRALCHGRRLWPSDRLPSAASRPGFTPPTKPLVTSLAPVAACTRGDAAEDRHGRRRRDEDARQRRDARGRPHPGRIRVPRAARLAHAGGHLPAGERSRDLHLRQAGSDR